MDINFELIIKSFPLLLAGAGITLEITALSVFFGLVIGCIVGIARLCNIKILRCLAAVYVDFLRGTPLLVQIFIVYFALPHIIGHRVDPFFAAISACSINSGAYIAEIFRGGLLAIDKGQYEAAQVLGLNKFQTTTRIIMPQMFRIALPALSNESVTLVKDTALLYAVAVPELLHYAQTVVNRDFTIVPFVIAGVIYLVITLILTLFFNFLEKRFKFE